MKNSSAKGWGLSNNMKTTAQKEQAILDSNHIIEVVGNVGSGKTTLAQKIAKSFRATYIDVDPYTANDFLSAYSKDKSRWAFTTALQFSVERSKIIQKVNELKKSVVLDHGFDSGLFMYPWTSYKTGEMNKQEWIFLQKLHYEFMKNLPIITTTIFIHASTSTIIKRLAERGRAHEKHYTKEYVVRLQKGVNQYKKILIKERSRKNIIEISNSGSTVVICGNNIPELDELLYAKD